MKQGFDLLGHAISRFGVIIILIDANVLDSCKELTGF